MTNSLKEEISLTITTIDTLIVNLKNNIRIDKFISNFNDD